MRRPVRPLPATRQTVVVTRMSADFKAKFTTRDGLRTCFEAKLHREGRRGLVARFGGIILLQARRSVIHDPAPAPTPYPHKEISIRGRVTAVTAMVASSASAVACG